MYQYVKGCTVNIRQPNKGMHAQAATFHSYDARMSNAHMFMFDVEMKNFKVMDMDWLCIYVCKHVCNILAT
jgi:hypothetical protein